MLTDVVVRQARPKEKEYKLSDQRGLLLVVRPTGVEWWRLRYKIQGRENMPSLRVHRNVSCADPVNTQNQEIDPLDHTGVGVRRAFSRLR